MRYKKVFIVMGVLVAVCVLFHQCVNSSAAGDPRGPQYAGSESCVSCHKDVISSFSHDPHFKTSGKVNDSLLASYLKADNNVGYYGDSSFVRVEKRDGNFVQSHIRNGKTVRSEKIDFAIGAAVKAQTYTYWKNSQLFQLPLTYFVTRQQWTNSPGYPMDKPYFDRVILSRCLECHASYVAKTEMQTGSLEVSEQLAANTIVPGIDCERCHGPAAEHVSFQQKNPGVKQAKFIRPMRSLSRQQQLDLCGVCHSGNDLDVQRTLFAFRPGDTLSQFFFPHFGAGKPNPDVHGKQVQLLAQSKCFQMSEMTCGTCHSAHSQSKDLRVFVSKCMSCHQASAHAKTMASQTTNCIDCHMPQQESKALDFNNGLERKSIPYLLRTHRIAVYPAAR